MMMLRVLRANPLFLLLLAPPLLAGCVRDAEFGSTVEHNIVAQAVSMDPQYAGIPVEGAGSGRRSADAIGRYQAGEVKPLLKVTGESEVGKQGGATDKAALDITPKGK